jgi:hypothetical protein
VCRAYLRHGRFWLDAIAVVPFLYLVAIIASGVDTSTHKWVSFVSLLRLVRLLRVFSLSRVGVAAHTHTHTHAHTQTTNP